MTLNTSDQLKNQSESQQISSSNREKKLGVDRPFAKCNSYESAIKYGLPSQTRHRKNSKKNDLSQPPNSLRVDYSSVLQFCQPQYPSPFSFSRYSSDFHALNHQKTLQSTSSYRKSITGLSANNPNNLSRLDYLTWKFKRLREEGSHYLSQAHQSLKFDNQATLKRKVSVMHLPLQSQSESPSCIATSRTKDNNFTQHCFKQQRLDEASRIKIGNLIQ